MSKFNKIWTWSYQLVLLHIPTLNFGIGELKGGPTKNASLAPAIYPEHKHNTYNIEFKSQPQTKIVRNENYSYNSKASIGGVKEKRPVMKPHVKSHVPDSQLAEYAQKESWGELRWRRGFW